MKNYKLDIAILCAGMEIYPNIMKEKSLGGSETAGIEMAHALSRRGHNVKLFCNFFYFIQTFNSVTRINMLIIRCVN